ncbi:hypothetical protein [Sphingobium yanoikuyae]|uniref:hypothetical protein n=1 Tax=Sphingobium yanoikuyae TaxID=13690 RepID=UPI0028AA46EF|nr:hypothetical protein [Sphingobium yanoikuyae]
MAQPLETRITAALRDSSRLRDVETTIGDVRREITDTQKRCDQETARSVDPALTTPQAREARNNAADLEHDIRRLNASLELLNRRRQTILDDDAYAKRRARYDAAKKERDDLALHIRARYPEIAMELVAMARRIQASEAECKIVNMDRPRDEPVLESAEHLARACGYYWKSGGEVTRIGSIKLPFLMMNGNYLPIQTSNITQGADQQRKQIELDQQEAKLPLAIDGAAPPADAREAADA